MKRLFTFAALLILTLGHASSLLTDQWRKTGFVGSNPSQLTLETAPGSLSMLVTTDANRNDNPEMKRIFSVYQPLPECDRNGELKLTFEARCQSAKPFYLITVVGSSPGNCPPGTHSVVHLTAEWQPFTVTLPLPGIKDNSVFEFIWEGVMTKGDKIELRNIKLEEDESRAVAQCYVRNPSNLLLDPASPNQTLTGVLLPLRSQENGTWSAKIFDEFNQQNPCQEVSGKLTRPVTEWSLDGANLPEGKYQLVFELTSADGKKAAPIVKKWQKTAAADTLSFVRGNTLYRKNQSFVPIGLYHAGLWNMDRVNEIRRKLGEAELDYDSMYRDIAAHGFNTVHSVANPDGSDIKNFAAAAGKHGLLVVPELRSTAKYTPLPYENLLGWYGRDEASSGLSQKEGRELYADLRNLDPSTPVFAANYITGITDIIRDKGCLFDVLLFDHYVIREKDTDFSELSREMAQLQADIRKSGELVFGYVPQAFIYNGPEPSPEQLKLQVYLGIIHGVRAFMYYSYNEDYDHTQPFNKRKDQFPALPDGMSKNPRRQHWWIPDSILWDQVGALNGEIQALSDFILADGVALRIASQTPQIDFAAKEVNGVKYFIALNLTAKPVTAVFRAGDAIAFRGKFDDRELNLKRGTNQLEFAPYEVKVFSAK